MTADVSSAATSQNLAAGMWGTCAWELSGDGVLHLLGGAGADTGGDSPWTGWEESVVSIAFDAPVAAPAECFSLFSGFKNLTSIEGLSSLDTSNVEDMFGLFSGCSSLVSLELPSTFDISNAKDMACMFSDCSSLESLALPESFDTSSVKDMYGMFSGCSSLAYLDLPGVFDTSSVEDMYEMFLDCSSLEVLELPDAFDTSSVEDMCDMFSGCSSLASLVLPAAFDTSNAMDAEGMFAGVDSLVRVELKGEGFTLEDAFPAPGVDAADGAHTGRWRAVGNGSDANPLGEAYDAVPLRTAGVFVPELVRHTVACALPDGSAYDAQEVNHGIAAMRPADPAREGYLFAGWKLLDGSAYDWDAPVVADVSLAAAFELPVKEKAQNPEDGSALAPTGDAPAPSALAAVAILAAACMAFAIKRRLRGDDGSLRR
ncbi:BspA family leucine-rich repeat surface protein [Arabiibacter massiliensis]|uniref:BspA family leucine-rich repeat surface protein n=1 Tax=Arabiibacter massiliensis TaxID=1870985 RepID=UPI00155A357B|nr:BspA family leucine-rich repeat surface protein [Arabiibacter massiliensis]